MTALPPDQLQAIQAILAQQAPSQAEHIAQSIAVTVQQSPITTAALTRALLIDGTATQAVGLDQLLLRTGQGDFIIRVPESAARQQLLDNLPSRVSLQIRPGPNGLEAVLVVGSRAAQQIDQVQQSFASSSALARQTLTNEIPRVGQVFQATVVPSTLLSNLVYNQAKPSGKSTQSGQIQTVVDPATGQIKTVAREGIAGATQAGGSSAPSTAQFADAQIHQANEGSQTSRNIYDQNSTQGQQPQAKQQDAPPHDHEQVAAGKHPLGLQQGLPDAVKAVEGAGPKLQLLPMRILNVATPETQLQGIPLPNEKAQVAVVRGTMPSGQPILTIDDQVVVVNTNKNWAVGTKLQINLGAGAELVVPRDHQAQSAVFENLRQIFETIAQQNPTIINEFKAFRMPQALSGHMAGPMLFFLSAMRKGNITQWLGNEVREVLEASGKQVLLKAFSDEMEAGRAPALDNTGSLWRGTTIPYLDGDKLHQFRFYVHDDQRGNQPPKQHREHARRFLIDVSLTRLGPIQIDGLVHTKKLDLIVRTVNTLPEDLRNDLRVRFAGAMEEIRYTGSLIFQNSKHGWVEMKSRLGNSLSREL